MRNSKGILNFIKLISPSRNFSGYKLLFLSLVVLLASCDPLFIGPMGRYNRQDDKSSLIRFDAFSYGDGQVFVGWNWLDQERAVRNDIPLLESQWDKIVIKEREDALPLSRLGGIEISVTDDTWYKVFSDLEYNSEYYFALWPHEKDGEWLAPVYINRHVDRPEPSGLMTATLVDAFSFDILGTAPGNYLATAVGTDILTVTDTDWYILYFDPIDSNVVVKSAELTLDIDDVTSSGTLIINSIRWDDGEFFELDPNPTLERQIATETFVGRNIEAGTAVAGPETYDISNIFGRALYHGPGILVLRATAGSSIEIDTSTVIPKIEYEGVWRW